MSLPCGYYNVNYRQDMAIVRTRPHWMILVLGLVALLALPLFASGRILSIMNLIGITVILVHGLNILTGYCGQISLGHAAFMMVGAYISALLTVYLKISFWLALPIAGLGTGIIGLIFGAPSLRVKGFYLAMATLAAQFIIPWVIVNVRPDITGGSQSFRVPAPTLGGIVLNTQADMFYIIIPIACLMTFFAKNLARTRMGRAFVAIRDNDLAAEVMGINVFRYKLFAFFISAVFAGISGSLWAHWMRVVAYTHFELQHSIWFLGMVIVGGMGYTTGPVMGAAFIRILDEFSAILSPIVADMFPAIAGQVSAALTPIVFGLVVLLFIVFEPRGLAHRWEIFKATYRIWPFSY